MLVYAWLSECPEPGCAHVRTLAFTTTRQAPAPLSPTVRDGLVLDETKRDAWQPAGCWLAEDVTVEPDGLVTFLYGVPRHASEFHPAPHWPSRARRLADG